jgi:predicted HTH domain antitoxin
MQETTFEVRIPKSLTQFGLSQDDVQRQVSEWLVLSLFTDERISSGKAARLLDISRVDFLTLLKKRGIAYINYSEEELVEEFTAVSQLQLPNAE